MFSENEAKKTKIQEIYDARLTHPKPGTLVDKDLKQWLTTATPFLDDDVPIMQRVWHVVHNISQPVNCACCDNLVTWRRSLQQYSQYCSPKCSRNSDTVKQKIKHTNIQKYGVEHIGAAKHVRDKINDTVKQRYGVDNVSQMQTVKDKKVATCLSNLSTTHPTKNIDVINKRRQNNLAKYGHINILGSEYGISKTQQTNVSKYGNKHYKQSLIDPLVLEKLNDRVWMHEQHVVRQQTLQSIGKKLGVNETTVGVYLHKHGIETKMFYQSAAEREIVDVLSNYVDVQTRNKTIIKPYELDIVIESHKLAIEYCGIFWHSEQMGKDKHYHSNKYNLCKQQGYQLITIFSDEWENRKEIVINMLLSKINQNNKLKIHGRETCVSVVDKSTKASFHNTYHIQGNCNSTIDLGLYHKHQLVAVMSFKQTKNNNFYLERYSSSCLVRGGFSKLLKHFVNNYQCSNIISFADLRHSNGGLYLKNGFTLDSILPPDYSYSMDGHTRHHKFNFRHKYLKNKLTNYDPLRSETENCDTNNVLRLWDCGKMKFVLSCPAKF